MPITRAVKRDHYFGLLFINFVTILLGDIGALNVNKKGEEFHRHLLTVANVWLKKVKIIIRVLLKFRNCRISNVLRGKHRQHSYIG